MVMESQAIAEFRARQTEWDHLGYCFRSALEPPRDGPQDDPGEPYVNPLSEPADSFLSDIFRTMVKRQTVKPFCESPIEEDFAVAFTFLAKALEIDVVFTARLDAPRFQDVTLLIVPQWPLDSYRYDFMVRHTNGRRALIECDGKQFHSSHEQVANDRRKDAAAERAKIPLLRFRGTELFRTSIQCAAAALRELGLRA